jgi:hypothetical protein
MADRNHCNHKGRALKLGLFLTRRHRRHQKRRGFKRGLRPSLSPNRRRHARRTLKLRLSPMGQDRRHKWRAPKLGRPLCPDRSRRD